MKLWITTVIAGACLTLGANVLLAQPADGAGGAGGKMQRKGAADRPAPGDRERAGQRNGDQAGAGQAGDRGRAGQRGSDQAGQGRDGRKPPVGPMGPLMIALDTDKDGVLSAEEIAAASENLKKLDKNGDGKIDHIELRPPLPRGRQGDSAQGPSDGKGQRNGANAQDGQGRRGGQGAQDGARRRPPQGDGASEGQRPGPRGQRQPDRRPPTPPAASQE